MGAIQIRAAYISFLVTLISVISHAHSVKHRAVPQILNVQNRATLDKSKNAIENAFHLPASQRKAVLVTHLLLLDEILSEPIELQLRWEALGLYQLALKDESTRDEYQKSHEPNAQHLLNEGLAKNPISLLEAAQKYPFTPSGQRAIEGLVKYYFENGNPILGEAYVDYLEDLYKQLSIAPNSIGNLRKFQLPADPRILADAFKNHWTMHYHAGRRMGPYLTDTIRKHQITIEKAARQTLPALESSALGKHLITVNDESALFSHTTHQGFNRPQRLQRSEKIKKVVSGHLTCLLTASGKIRCVENATGGYMAQERAVDICSAGSLFCSVTEKSEIKCWNLQKEKKGAKGSLAHWQHETLSESKEIVQDANIFLKEHGGAKNIFCGPSGGLCAITGENKTWCWNGVRNMDENTQIIIEKEGLKQIALGKTPCALTQTGRVICWGSSLNTLPLEVERFLKKGGGAKQIAMFSSSVCAVTQDGGVHCWDLEAPQGIHTIPPAVLARLHSLGGATQVLASSLENSRRVCVVPRTRGILLCWEGNHVFEADFDSGSVSERVEDWNRRWREMGII